MGPNLKLFLGVGERHTPRRRGPRFSIVREVVCLGREGSRGLCSYFRFSVQVWLCYQGNLPFFFFFVSMRLYARGVHHDVRGSAGARVWVMTIFRISGDDETRFRRRGVIVDVNGDGLGVAARPGLSL